MSRASTISPVTPPTIPGLPLASWPADAPTRRGLTIAAQALGQLAALVRWAHEQTTADGQRGPVLATWAALLGVSRATLATWRARDPELGALPLAQRGDAGRWRRTGTGD